MQVTLSLATLVPATPGGIGTEQAFLADILRGAAPSSVLLAFSVGMRITLTAVNVIAGIVAILLTLGNAALRRADRPPASTSAADELEPYGASGRCSCA